MRFERLILALGTFTAAGTGTGALAAIDPLDALSVCSRIEKNDARLECYDQVARDVAAGHLQSRSSAGQPDWAAPPVGGADEARPQANPQSAFGSNQVRRSEPSREEAAGPDAIRTKVASSTDNGLGQWRIKLADGAIWQMTESAPRFRPPAPNETIVIRKASMGSFLMDVGKQEAVRVRRVR